MANETLKLISQLAIGATWMHLDDGDTTPVQAAAEVLDLVLDADRAARLDAVVDAAPNMDWTEQVAMALHLLLTSEATDHRTLAVAA